MRLVSCGPFVFNLDNVTMARIEIGESGEAERVTIHLASGEFFTSYREGSSFKHLYPIAASLMHASVPLEEAKS